MSPSSTNQNRSDIKIVLSIGLLAAIFVHAITMATANRIAPYVEQAIFNETTPTAPVGGINFDAVRGAAPVNSLPVNAAARDEVKGAQSCTNCPTPSNTANKQTAPATPRVVPKVQPTTVAATSKPVKPRYSITFFVRHNETRSQNLIAWVNNDPTLNKWKNSANFHIYAPGNELYKARFANVVPVDYFPAVLVTAPDGGHVYFSSQSNIPSTPRGLAEGIIEAVNLHKQIIKHDPIPSQPQEPATFRLVSASINATQCDEDGCNPSQVPVDQHASGFLDLIKKPKTDDPVEGLLRRLIAPQVSATAILLVIIGAVVLAYFIKRG